MNRIADADTLLETAENAVDIARAREIAKFARWDAERRLKLFQPKQEQTTDSKITVIVQRGIEPAPLQVVGTAEAQESRQYSEVADAEVLDKTGE